MDRQGDGGYANYTCPQLDREYCAADAGCEQRAWAGRSLQENEAQKRGRQGTEVACGDTLAAVRDLTARGLR